ALEAEVSDLAERFETRKLVERAKGLLNDRMGMTEPEAFRWIQKTSMDRRLSMREVAQTVVDQFTEPKQTSGLRPRGRARSRVAQQVRHAHRLEPAAVIVREHYLVHRLGAAETDSRARARHPPRAGRLRVTHPDIDPHRDPPRPRVHVRRRRAER